jgi:hypothetical protein
MSYLINNLTIKPLLFVCVLFLTLTTATSFSTAATNKRFVLIPQPKSNETTPQLISALQKWDELQLKIAQECKDMAIENNPSLKKEKMNEFYKLSYSVLINNDDLYSLIVKTFRYCGGAYPSIDENAIVFKKKMALKLILLIFITSPKKWTTDTKSNQPFSHSFALLYFVK